MRGGTASSPVVKTVFSRVHLCNMFAYMCMHMHMCMHMCMSMWPRAPQLEFWRSCLTCEPVLSAVSCVLCDSVCEAQLEPWPLARLWRARGTISISLSTDSRHVDENVKTCALDVSNRN